jgi:carboxypeptidase T
MPYPNPATRFPMAIFVAVLLMCAAAAFAANSHHRLIEIDTSMPAARMFIGDHGHRLDIVSGKPGLFLRVAATPEILRLLNESGVEWKTIIPDMEAQQAYAEDTTNFGAYHTYDENAAFVDSLRLLYPEVVSEKWSIGQSVEGREIWCFRVSDNPDMDEGEPEVLLDGMHHAREIMSAEFVILFAEHLAKNYGVDSRITWLVDNRELYLVPIVNPDGCVYNESTNPAGGGMWRKNRRDNGDGSFGVDNNRNYTYMWSGGSSDPSDPTYRGLSAGSEPETQAMMTFINGRSIRTHDSIHTYSNLLLYPWGYDDILTVDDAAFVQLAAWMTFANGYWPGRPPDILYPVTGSTIDWAYGAQEEHAKIFSFTSEIGSSDDGYWPPEGRRIPLFLENLESHLILMESAGPFISIHSAQVEVAIPAKGPGPDPDGELGFTIENQSICSSAPAGVLVMSTDDPWIQLFEVERTYQELPPLGQSTLSVNPVPFAVDPDIPPGHVVEVTVTAILPEGDLTYQLAFPIGDPPTILVDDFESGTGAWTLEGFWNTTSARAHSPALSLTDSPAGPYANDTEFSAVMNGPLRFTRLGFWTSFSTEADYDYGRVQISSNDGPWVTLRSFEGLQSDWSYEEIDLSSYAGQDLEIRFQMDSDYLATDDGWYLDDVTLFGASAANAVPSVPVAIGPGEETVEDPVDLTVANSTDPEGDPLSYGFRIYADERCTDLVASADGIAEGSVETTWTAPGLLDGNYWWRAYAGDLTGRSLLNPALAFTVGDLSGVSSAVVIGPRLRVIGPVGAGRARLELTRAQAGNAVVEIFDARGARIRRLHSGHLDGGAQILVWDGRGHGGRQAASGVYFVRAETEGVVLVGRVVLVR